MLGLDLGSMNFVVLFLLALVFALLYYAHTRIGVIQRTMHHHTLMLAQAASSTQEGSAHDFAAPEAKLAVSANPPARPAGEDHDLVDVSDSYSESTFAGSESSGEEFEGGIDLRPEADPEPPTIVVSRLPAAAEPRAASALKVGELRAIVIQRDLMSAGEARKAQKADLVKLLEPQSVSM